ncbi:HAMP domain-containing protein, partial [Methanocaldococcus sp.]
MELGVKLKIILGLALYLILFIIFSIVVILNYGFSTTIVVFDAIAILLLAGLLFFYKKTIFDPMDQLVKVMEAFAKGETNIKIDKKNIKISPNDELGKIYYNAMKAYEVFKNKIEEMNRMKEDVNKLISDLVRVMEAVSNGNLTVRMDESGRRNKVQKAVNRALDLLSKTVCELLMNVNKLKEEVKEVNNEVERLKETSDQIADAANQVAIAATDQSNKLQDITQDL